MSLLLRIILHAVLGTVVQSELSWPQWRGPGGGGVSQAHGTPIEWDRNRNIIWRVTLPGEGTSSPIVVGGKIVLTYSMHDGTERHVRCIDAASGRRLWDFTLDDEFPELTSALTGWAAASPACDGHIIVAMFGNAGLVALDMGGRELWRRTFGYFESELGLASSPVIVGSHVYLVADHDGSRFDSFDSFVAAIDLKSGRTKWKVNRRGLFRSWSTPLVIQNGTRGELVVSAQDEVRSYGLKDGRELWRVAGNTGWVAPSPVFGEGLVFATSGRNGPTLAIRPGGTGDDLEPALEWRSDRGAPYVCSPLYYEGRLWVHTEQGVLTCYRACDGEVLFRTRLAGKFTSSGVAADRRIYITSEAGETYVIESAGSFRRLAVNSIGETVLASPAFDGRNLLIRGDSHLYKIGVMPN